MATHMNPQVHRVVDGNGQDVGSLEQLQTFWGQFKQEEGPHQPSARETDAQIVCADGAPISSAHVPVVKAASVNEPIDKHPMEPWPLQISASASGLTESEPKHPVPSLSPKVAETLKDDDATFLESKLSHLQDLSPDVDVSTGRSLNTTRSLGGPKMKESMNFPKHFMDVLISNKAGMDVPMTLDELATWIEESSHSSCFSGVAAPETAMMMLHREVQQRLPNRMVPSPDLFFDLSLEYILHDQVWFSKPFVGR